jgi:hypothetical protein
MTLYKRRVDFNPRNGGEVKTPTLANQRVGHPAGETGTDLIEGTNTLNKIIGGEQRELLKDFFKTGERPNGLSDRTLKIYKDIAQRAIDAGKDGLKVQAERIKMIANALK